MTGDGLDIYHRTLNAISVSRALSSLLAGPKMISMARQETEIQCRRAAEGERWWLRCRWSSAWFEVFASGASAEAEGGSSDSKGFNVCERDAASTFQLSIPLLSELVE